ncbi:universal stress protein [Candidatus Enterococcus murrayae]|uniref:Universal stress protein n=1 Tax=Candidatus Enterococcus murrayae TaxID=2815321 RepID=A0ABS3HID6_9ENTE|nr:universal stress protein [Enterococcus sp. MJM16]MBO0453231.1 universal stress protein [Enterococcus sp. MJM16]
MISKYKNILVAVDGSEHSEHAFEEAVEAAKRHDAKLNVISIINDSELSTSAFSFSKIYAAEKEQVEKEMLKKIHDASRKELENIEPFVDLGNPKEKIVEFAKENDIDMIYLGATGKGEISLARIGSTAAYVVNHAPCSVTVVR